MPGFGSPAAYLNILVTASTAQANAALAKTQAQLNTTAATAQTSSTKTAAAMKSVAKVGAAALAAGMVVAVKRGVEFEDQMVKIHTQAGASRAEVDRMSKAILEYAKTQSEANPIELAKGMFRVESAGFRGAKAMEVLAGAERLADVGASNLEDTATALTGAMKSNVKGAGNVTKAIGTLNAIVGAGNMRMSDLVAAMGTGFLSNAKQMGVSLKQAGAALATLTVQGQPATQAATRLSMAFRMMMSPTDQAAEAMRSIGLRANELGVLMQRGNFPGAIALLVQHLDALGKSPQALQQKATIIREMFGARSSSGINAIIQGLQDYNARLQQVGSESAKFHAKEIADDKTLQSQWNRLTATLDSYAVELGTAVIPALVKLLQAIQWVIRAIGNMVQWVRNARDNIGNFVSGAIQKLIGAFQNLPGVIKAALGGLANIILSPFRNAFEGIRGVIGNIRNVFEGLRGTVEKVVHKVAGLFGWLYQAIKNIGEAIVGAVNKIVGALKGPEIKIPVLPDTNESLLDFLRGQKGIRRVPGRGSGDKVAALLEPGEVVLNRNAVAALGGARNANRPNELWPRFAGGGEIGKNIARPAVVDMLGAALGFVKKNKVGRVGNMGLNGWGPVDALARAWNMTPGTYTGRLGQQGSWHGVPDGPGRARATDYSGSAHDMLIFARKVAKRWGSKLLELIHSPLGFSIDNGRRTAPFAVADHYDHVHVAMQRGGVVARAARAAGWRGADLIRAVAEAGGESSWNPRAVGDGGASKGLWQIYTKAHPEWAGKNLFDPMVNARAAYQIWRQQGWGAFHADHRPWLSRARSAVAGLSGGGGAGGGTTGKTAAKKQWTTGYPGISTGLLQKLQRDTGTQSAIALSSQMGAAQEALAAARTPAERIAAIQALNSVMAAQGGLVSARAAYRKAKKAVKAAGGKRAPKALKTKRRRRLEALIAAEQGLIPGAGEGMEDTSAADLAAAQEALRQEIEALRKSIDQQNAIAKSELAIGLAEARRAFADMLSGELGGRVTARGHTAGAGSVVRT